MPSWAMRPAALQPRADAELIAVAYRRVAVEGHLEQLLAADLAVLLVLERRDPLVRLGVEDLAGWRIGVLAVDAERDPARLIADGESRHLLRRHDGVVEDVDRFVVPVAY